MPMIIYGMFAAGVRFIDILAGNQTQLQKHYMADYLERFIFLCMNNSQIRSFQYI